MCQPGLKQDLGVWNQDPTGKTSQKCADIGNLGSGRGINHVLKTPTLCLSTALDSLWFEFTLRENVATVQNSKGLYCGLVATDITAQLLLPSIPPPS